MNISDFVVKTIPLTLSDDNRSSSQCKFKACLQVKQLQRIVLLIAQYQWLRFSYTLIFVDGT